MSGKRIGLSILALFLLMPKVMAADIAEFAQIIKDGAAKWSSSVQKLDDVESYMLLTYHPIHVLFGGVDAERKAYINAKPVMEEKMKKNGYTQFPEIVIGEPYNFLDINGHYYALVPQQFKEEASDGWDITDALLISISEDKGKTWTYFDPASLENEVVFYKVLPDLEGKMPWPKKNDYQFVPKPDQPQYGT